MNIPDNFLSLDTLHDAYYVAEISVLEVRTLTVTELSGLERLLLEDFLRRKSEQK